MIIKYVTIIVLLSIHRYLGEKRAWSTGWISTGCPTTSTTTTPAVTFRTGCSATGGRTTTCCWLSRYPYLQHSHHDQALIPRHTGTLRMSSTTARVWAARTIWAVLLLYTGTKQEEARRRLKRRRYYSCFILNFNAATAFFRIIIKINWQSLMDIIWL